MTYINMNEPFIDDLIPSYLDNRRRDLEQAKVFAQSKNHSALAMLAHKISGTAVSYGFSELDRIVRDLEVAAIGQNQYRVEELISEFEKFLSEQLPN